MQLKPGWTTCKEIESALRHYWTGVDSGGCTWFDQVGPGSVHVIASCMSSRALNDSQGCAPTNDEMIRVTLTNIGSVLLGGYRVNPPREDERISFDTLWVRGKEKDEAWEWLASHLPRLTYINKPDDMRISRDLAGGIWTRLWWD